MESLKILWEGMLRPHNFWGRQIGQELQVEANVTDDLIAEKILEALEQGRLQVNIK